uniref:Trehalose-6-phosphate phosphatase helical bundle domain-containing protein n=1 Tax=Globodera rostochiensis TaxID=31243 RepID=A0A914H5A4_GLORO
MFVPPGPGFPAQSARAAQQNTNKSCWELRSIHTVLQSHGCEKVHQLLLEFPIAWSDGQIEHRIFFVRPTISLACRICELIRSSPSYSYVIIVCGNQKNFFDRELERNGLIGNVRFLEFDLDFVNLESDLFSLELPQYAPEMFDRYFLPVAKSLWKLQVLYELGEAFASADQPISHVFLFDRRCDVPAVLLTGLTYESVLDDVFHYKCGKISFKSALENAGHENDNSKSINLNGVYALNNSDPIFSAIRNAHMTSVFPFLSTRAKMLQESFDKASDIKRIDEMKAFVSSELRNLKEQQKQLELHIFACEHILDEMKGTNERFSLEQAIVSGEYEDQKVVDTLLKLISSKCNLWVVLQVACIWSLRSQGLKSKFYRQFQKAFLHRYGFEKLTVLYKLRQHRLLTEKENFIAHPLALSFLGKNAKPFSAAFLPTENSKSNQSAPPLTHLVNMLRLCPPQIKNESQESETNKNTNTVTPDVAKDTENDAEKKRRNMAYVFSDAYIPLISHIVHGTVTNGWEETRLKRLFGEESVHCTNPEARPPDNRIRRAILVCFVGGVTYAEIASLRRFAQDHDFRLIMLTTHIINRKQFLQKHNPCYLDKLTHYYLWRRSKITDWDDLISKMEQNRGTIEDFKKLMYKCQSKRKEFVSLLLEHCLEDNDHQIQSFIEVTNQCLHFLNKTRAILDCGPSHMKEILSTNDEKLSIYVKDELFGMKKDIDFLDKFHLFFTERQNSAQKISISQYLTQMDFLSVLPHYHSIDFLKEHAECVRFMEQLRSGSANGAEELKPILITDWDGTMKDYCAQYATNLQPIYSAISLAQFSKGITRHTAVLTAGPLRGPGILDLIALPKDGPIVFGGSWGREWWLNGKRVVHDEGISDEGLNALERLSDEMSNLLEDKEFAHFGLIGSGVQRKVDRLTLGVQTVFNHVNAELSAKYQNEVKERVHRVDPNSQFLHFEPSAGLEVEVVVHKDGTVWNKAKGMIKIIETLGESSEKGKVLICGDTFSDIPMVIYGASKNPTGLMALFVTSDESLQQRVLEIVKDKDRCCFVSTPDVIHAAMMTLLKAAEQKGDVGNKEKEVN